MRMSALKVAAAGFAAVVALSAVHANAIPAGPLPITSGGGRTHMIPAGPLPINNGGGRTHMIPAGPLPINNGGGRA